jgi:hypothetical protein
VLLWSLAEWSVQQQIKEGLLDLGLGKYVPEPRTPAAALKGALEELFALPSQLVRPIKSKDGFTVVEEFRGANANSYATLLTAKIDKDLRITTTPYDQTQAEDLVKRFNTHMGLLGPAQVGGSLVAILKGMGATSLRPGGALYWLPEDKLDQWQGVCGVYQGAGKGRQNNLYVIRNVMDADAIRAVRDAIVNEVRSDAYRIEREVQSGELGEKALENRKEQAEELRRKIGVYEDILGIGLNQLTDAVNKADNAACVAALTLSVATGLVEAGV